MKSVAELQQMVEDSYTRLGAISWLRLQTYHEEIKDIHRCFTYFEKQARKQGFTNLRITHTSNTSFTATIYKPSIGVRIAYYISWPVSWSPDERRLCHFTESFHNFVIAKRRGNGYRSDKRFERKGDGFKVALEGAIDHAAALRGEDKKDIKQIKEDGKIPDKLWRRPDPEIEKNESGYTRRNLHIASANVQGFCTIDNKGRILKKDYETPGVAAYFLVHTYDFNGRQLYFITDDCTRYLLALPRGSMVFIAEDKKLFDNGRNSLEVKNISVGDLDFIKTVIERWCL